MTKQMESLPTAGLIGLGNAGMALASALQKNFRVIGYDRDAQRCQQARHAGVTVAPNAAEVARQCTMVLLSLPTPRASLEAARELSLGGLAQCLVIETSTVGPRDVLRLQELVAGHGGTVMDAAIVGGIDKLAQGQTTFLVGALPADFARAQPLLECAAATIFHLGDVGTGMRAKLVNNAVAHTTMVVLLEGAALAAKAGISSEMFYTLMERESGLTRPLTHRLGERVRTQNFDGGMPTANARKDSLLAIEMAAELGVPLFAMQASHTAYDIACAEGLERMDYAALSKLWEHWADISLGPSESARQPNAKSR